MQPAVKLLKQSEYHFGNNQPVAVIRSFSVHKISAALLENINATR